MTRKLSKFETMVNLHLKRDQLSAKVDAITAEIKDLEEIVIKEMANEGLTHVNTAKGNLRINRIIRASAGGDMPGLIKAMQKAGKGEMVKETVNGTSLGAWVREFDPTNSLSPQQIEQKLPAPLRGKIKITEQIDIRVTGKKG